MDSTEEIRLCEQDIREAEDKIVMARLRIAHLRGEGPWHGKPAPGVEPTAGGGAPLTDLLRAREDVGAANPLAREAAYAIWEKEIAFATVIDTIDTAMRAGVLAEREACAKWCDHAQKNDEGMAAAITDATDASAALTADGFRCAADAYRMAASGIRHRT